MNRLTLHPFNSHKWTWALYTVATWSSFLFQPYPIVYVHDSHLLHGVPCKTWTTASVNTILIIEWDFQILWPFSLSIQLSQKLNSVSHYETDWTISLVLSLTKLLIARPIDINFPVTLLIFLASSSFATLASARLSFNRKDREETIGDQPELY